MNKKPAVYILATGRNGTLYVGVTGNLHSRMNMHLEGIDEGFTYRYEVYQLVYFERFALMTTAIKREKQLKGWKRQWKLDLIERHNPHWRKLWVPGKGFDLRGYVLPDVALHGDKRQDRRKSLDG